MTAKTDLKPAARPLPADLADVALIDGSTCAATGGMSISWWLEEVQTGRAPQPAIRKVRCTRWRMSDVRAYWAARAADGDAAAAALVIAKATKASVAAQAKRRAAAVAQAEA